MKLWHYAASAQKVCDLVPKESQHSIPYQIIFAEYATISQHKLD